MPDFATALNPSYFRFILKRLLRNRLGVDIYPPRHFYSPLLDFQSLGPNDSNFPFDGADLWEHINLRQSEQRSYYEELLDRFPLLPFPSQKTDNYRYFTDNLYFKLADAFTLSGVIRKEKPCRIVEIGSGFSSAVMLDTLCQTLASTELTFIEPEADRLYSLISAGDRSISKALSQRVQEVPLSVFDRLEAQDLLVCDSSHVAKIGSDVTHVLLRILPRLKLGVLVHFHDVFYPFSYPATWIREGRAWNESLFLRAFLVGNIQFQLVAFNCCAGYSFPELFQDRLPAFLSDTGGSI